MKTTTTLTWVRNDRSKRLEATGRYQDYTISLEANPHTLRTRGTDSQQVPTYIHRAHMGTIVACKARAEYIEALKKENPLGPTGSPPNRTA